MAGSIQENKTGKIASYYDADSGLITEDGSGSNLDFYHPGSQVQHPVGGGVVFLKVTTPSGKIIVRDIKAKV